MGRLRAREPAGDWLDDECARCAGDYDRFNTVILGRPRYWSRQREVCESLRRFRTTVVVTGNAVGKSYNAAGNVLGFACGHPGSRTVAAAPTLAQLSGVLWSETEAAYRSAEANGLPLGGRLKRLNYQLGDKWQVEGFGSGSVEARSGRHAADLLAAIDEASGVPEPVLEAIDSLNPSRYLYYGNPIRPEGRFFELAEHSGDNPTVNVIRIPSLESPDIGLERSPRGMADKGWLDDARAKYGEESLWWMSHVLARFPGSLVDGLLPPAWLELAARTVHVRAGDAWLGIDLGGGGGGGDPSELVARDSNGILEEDGSASWSFETTAEKARAMADRHHIAPGHVVFDQAGIGADFGNRLRAAGIHGARGYMGASDGGVQFTNLRAAVHWALRRRLDPQRTYQRPDPQRAGRTLWVPAPAFSLPAHLLVKFRAELTGARYLQTGKDQIAMEPKTEFQKRLKRSPNFLDAWAMTYAFPHA